MREHLQNTGGIIMGLKKLLGDDYKEELTIEEINELLEGKNFVDPETLPKSVDKKVFDKTASELAAIKKKLKAVEQAAMTDEEKIKEEMQKATELQNQFQRELAKIRAKEIFVEAGLKAEDYTLILDSVVTEDEETTQTRAEAMVKLVNAQKEAVEKAVKAELLKGTPKPPAGDGGAPLDFTKQINEARENGDMVTMASLIRQQQMLESQKE